MRVLVVLGLVALGVSAALARPVHVGRYVEIAYGISTAHPWRTGEGDRARSGRSTVNAPSERPSKAWESRVGVGRVFSPAITDEGTLFVGSQAGVAAVDAAGTVRWAIRLGLVSGTPSLTPEGNVAVGAQPGELLVVGGAQSLVHAEVGGGVRGSPLVLDDGSMVVAAYDQAIHRFDAEGRRVFRTAVTTHVRGAVALTTEGLLVAPVGRELMFLSLRGQIVRTVALGAEASLGPAVSTEGAAWVLTSDGTLMAVTSNGRVSARADVGVRPSAASNIAIAPDGSVRFATAESGIVCVGPNGTERWRYGRADHSGGVTVDSSGVTLTVSQVGRMVALSPQGNVLWSVNLDARTDAAPVLAADGTILVATFGGTVQAWR